MKVQVITAGALTRSLPEGRAAIEGDDLTVRRLLDSLVARYGSPLAKELLSEGKLREGLVLLVNGRNVLSLPRQFDTPLHDQDEVLVTIVVAGG